MTRFLVYLSLLLTGGLSAYSQNPGALPQDTVFRYGFEMSMQKGGLTGVALTRLDNNAIYGSIINEFGVSALDFTYDIRRGKVKLNHLVSFLDKWYIRRVLRADLRVCLDRLYGLSDRMPKKHDVLQNGSTLTVCNLAHDISYSFTPLAHDSQQ